MRIRKGHRCLPLAPADSSFLREESVQPGKDIGMIGSAKKRLKEEDLPVDTPGTDRPPRIGCRGASLVQEGSTKDTSEKKRKCLEYDLPTNRVSTDDNKCSVVTLDTGVTEAATKVAELMSQSRSFSTRHKPSLATTQTIRSRRASVTKYENRLDILEQSLGHVCAKAGKSGLSARDAVAQIREHGLRGLNEGGAAGPIEQVMNLFRSSSKFVKCDERWRLVVLDAPASAAKERLVVADSEVSKRKVDSSSDMFVVKQVKNLQSSPSFSLGAGSVELRKTPAVDRHARNRKAVANISEVFVKQSKGGRDDSDFMAPKQKASLRGRFRSQKVMQTVQTASRSQPQCKRDDGKGWRCSRPAEEGFNMCPHHNKRSTSLGQRRRKKGKLGSRPTKSPKCDSRFVTNSRVVPNSVTTAGCWSPFLDDELAHDENRPSLKAKSMKSILSQPPKKSSHIRKAV